MTHGHFLTPASKFNIEPNGGIFDVSPENDRASPNMKTPLPVLQGPCLFVESLHSLESQSTLQIWHSLQAWLVYTGECALLLSVITTPPRTQVQLYELCTKRGASCNTRRSQIQEPVHHVDLRGELCKMSISCGQQCIEGS